MEKNKKRKRIALLVQKAWHRQCFSISVLLVMMFVSSMSLFSSVTLIDSGTKSMNQKMETLGFGDFTVWTAGGSEELAELAEEIKALPDVGTLTSQELIYAGYEVNGYYSDNDGQLLCHDGKIPYHFIDRFGQEVKAPAISEGQIYISPAMESMFQVKTGDTITFELARVRGKKSFVVAGYFEDAFMGSSMIDMKSFLVSETDYEEMRRLIANTEKADNIRSEAPAADKDSEALGKQGAMFHISQKEGSRLSESEFHRSIQENTAISRYIEFSYNRESILSYMLLLQNILSGFLLIFSIVLFVICLIMIRHNLRLVIEQEKKDIAILRTIGFSGKELRQVYLMLYGAGAVAALLLGLLCGSGMAVLIAKGMISSTGMLLKIHPSIWLLLGIFFLFLALLAAFLYAQTKRILRIAPMEVLRETAGIHKVRSPLHRQGFFPKTLLLHIALREILAEKKKYFSLSAIAILLTLFLSVAGLLGSWLGPNGEGLMNAFSAADHDIGVQPFNRDVPMDEIERVIHWYSPITDKYELAMQSVSVNGQDYTANILNDTQWFHILRGNVCDGNSILITEVVANELQADIGDTVSITANGRTESYQISGIYQCANGMGTNIGMSMDGYSKIGDITGFIWCYHYIMKDGSMRDYAYEYLNSHYQGIDVHTNSWSGLDGIVQLMHLLIAILYGITALVILGSVMLIAGKLLQAETFHMAVYKSLGLQTSALRISFVLRFFSVTFAGAVIGIILSMLLTDSLIGMSFRTFGIGEFAVGFSILGYVVPLIIIPLLFTAFAWIYSAKLKKLSVAALIAENE